jgi:hypothetical protein
MRAMRSRIAKSGLGRPRKAWMLISPSPPVSDRPVGVTPLVAVLVLT